MPLPQGITALIQLPTNAAFVDCQTVEFADINGTPDQNFLRIYCSILFNGSAGEAGDYITIARNATQAERQAAVRSLCNLILASREPGITLNNANINIMRMPI